MSKAVAKKNEMNKNKACAKDGCANVYGKELKARVVAFVFQNRERESDLATEIDIPWPESATEDEIWDAIQNHYQGPGLRYDFFYQCKNDDWVGANIGALPPGSPIVGDPPVIKIYSEDEVKDSIDEFIETGRYNAFRYCVECQIPRRFTHPNYKPTSKR